ncbi:MAG: hypothetical protein JXQ99_05110 [Hyphomicrobiaceae bacterium]
MSGSFNLRILLVAVITGLVLAATAGVSLVHMTAFESYARKEAVRTIDSAAAALRSKTERLLMPAANTIRYLQSQNILRDGSSASMPRKSQFSTFLRSVEIVHRSNPQIESTYIGYADGSFVIETRNSPSLLKAVRLPLGIKSDHLRLTRDLTVQDPLDQWSHQQGDNWRFIRRSVSAYQPRKRPWYRLGRTRETPAWTGLYRYIDDGYGITLVAALRDAKQKLAAVIGVDVRLEKLTSFVRDLELGSNGLAFIARPNGELFAHAALTRQLLVSRSGKRGPTLAQVSGSGSRDVRLFEALAKGRADTAEIEIDGQTILGRRMVLRDIPGFDGHLYVGASLSDFTRYADQVANRTLVFALVFIALVVAAGTWIARAISRPVHEAAGAMTAVARLELGNRQLEKRSWLAEIQDLNTSVNTMQSALLGFVRYVPRDVVRDLLDLRLPLELGGDRRDVTVLFTDIESFTTLAEQEQPEALIDGLADYFDIISDVVHSHGGTVDKFIGDSVMAIWGAPRYDTGHTQYACSAVVEIERRLAALNQQRAEAGATPLITRYGLHRGTAFVGNIGARDRFNYTAVGDVVNTAARLESANKDMRTRALVSQAVVDAVGEDHSFVPRGEIRLLGKSAPIAVFELPLGHISGNSESGSDGAGVASMQKKEALRGVT